MTRRPGRLAWAAIALLGLVVACALDVPLMRLAQHRPGTYEKLDLVQFLRAGGYLPLWFSVAAMLILEGRRRAGRWSNTLAHVGVRLVVTVVAAGILAEMSKLVFRRERADLAHAWYAYRPIWESTFHSGGLSMPSSHALVAFAGAFALGRHFRAARPVLIAFALGTAASRIGAGAHYVSDTYVSGLLAAWTARRVPPLLRAAAHRLAARPPAARRAAFLGSLSLRRTGSNDAA